MMLVVMAHVDREDSFEVPAVHDQDPVQRHSQRAVPVQKTFSWRRSVGPTASPRFRLEML